MPAFYAKERAKYGNLTGQVIIWPVQYEGDPTNALNAQNLPAGYLKCDGTKYLADDYPALAAVLGVGTACKFARRNADGTFFDEFTDTQFMVPDLGSKYPEPTSGANAGLYNNIRLDNALGNEVSRSGIGIEVASAIGTDVNITYSGSITVPSQEIPIRGRPGWNYAGDTHYTDSEGVEENAVHPHTHFHSAVRARNLSVLESSSNNPVAEGRTSYRNASTIAIQDWLDATTNSSGEPGSAQEPCRAMSKWSPGDGGGPTSRQQFVVGEQETVYWGGCIFGAGQYTYNCISNDQYDLDGAELEGSPDGSNTVRFKNAESAFGICVRVGAGDDASFTNQVPVTYAQGYPGVPLDFDNNSLHDVVPLQSNDSVNDATATTDVENIVTDTVDLTIAAGTDPTLHNHRIDLDRGEHNYTIKTRAIVVPPENLSTTMSIGTDSSVSVDSACAPFIVMEYLIKI